MISTWAELSADRQRTVQKYLDDTAIGKEIASRAEGDLDFALWLIAVERACQRQFGVSFTDLADYNWRECHADEMSPQGALMEAVKDEGLV
ncbi:hypothetical protein [Amycolatopsis sp. NPDC004079]|uniref:hypothetical protein n=1 Tax=Amycolatopsis sp. NPDC004079 TaxID=3154549 RepID=UPI0033A0B53D